MVRVLFIASWVSRSDMTTDTRHADRTSFPAGRAQGKPRTTERGLNGSMVYCTVRVGSKPS